VIFKSNTTITVHNTRLPDVEDVWCPKKFQNNFLLEKNPIAPFLPFIPQTRFLESSAGFVVPPVVKTWKFVQNHFFSFFSVQ